MRCVGVLLVPREPSLDIELHFSMNRTRIMSICASVEYMDWQSCSCLMLSCGTHIFGCLVVMDMVMSCMFTRGSDLCHRG
jgi:hypothetical protein